VSEKWSLGVMVKGYKSEGIKPNTPALQYSINP